MSITSFLDVMDIIKFRNIDLYKTTEMLTKFYTNYII